VRSLLSTKVIKTKYEKYKSKSSTVTPAATITTTPSVNWSKKSAFNGQHDFLTAASRECQRVIEWDKQQKQSRQVQTEIL